jgi:phosphatidylglycerol:prolipoprotein diacylglycerol transferase
VKDTVRKTGILTSLFVILYGMFRFIVEFFRQPDPQLGYVAGIFTMGQLLSGFMMVAGTFFLIMKKRR